MATNENTSKRSLTVLAVVVACFAVLWPKIFYPMIQSILFPSDEEEIEESIRKLNFDDMLHPQMRESMGEARPAEKLLRDGSRGSFHPYLRQATKPQSKGAGAVNLVVPVYTIAIILFFLYSLLKMALKRYDETYAKVEKPSTSLCPNAFCARIYSEKEAVSVRKEIAQERKAQRALEQYGKDKVLTALKTIILEMEDIKGNFSEINLRSKMDSDYTVDSNDCEAFENL